MNVYEIVTNKIIEKLEQGEIPWRKPWFSTNEIPKNFVTKKAYRGINILLLGMLEYTEPYFLTFRQANKLGGKIKKGEKGNLIVFWKVLEYEEENKDGEIEIKKRYFLRYYKVFNIEQTEGIEYESVLKDKTREETNKLEQCEEILQSYKDRPEIRHNKNRAYYETTEDYINLPAQELFDTDEEYYSTMFHELIHSTGHSKRLARKEVVACSSFGDETYAQEELVAELGSAFLCNLADIEFTTLENQTAYIQGWLKRLKSDSRFIIFASSKAEKAVNYILNKEKK